MFLYYTSASIISKKAAEQLDALVLDVKYGVGAFMVDEKKSRELAQQMVRNVNSHFFTGFERSI